MGLCGLWHGAGFTFIIWGLMHGLALIVCHVWQRNGRELSAPIGWAVTMVFVIVGWVVFRADDFAEAGRILAGMAGAGGIVGKLHWPLVIAAATVVSLVGPSTKDFVEENLRPRPIYGAAFAATAVLVILLVGMGQPQNFIYFQF